MVARFLVQRLNFTLAPSIAGDRLRPPRNASLSVLNINSSLNFGSIERYGDDEHLQRDPDHQRS
jgi:riboflavin biosynthesis pyrimidine reductase